MTMMIVVQFEYQQAQLEAEVENLSWKVERAEITDRGVRCWILFRLTSNYYVSDYYAKVIMGCIADVLYPAHCTGS